MTENKVNKNEQKPLNALEETLEAFSLIKRSNFFATNEWMKDREYLYDKIEGYTHFVYKLNPGDLVSIDKVSQEFGLEPQETHLLMYVITLGYFTNPSCGFLQQKFEGDDGVVIPSNLIFELVTKKVEQEVEKKTDEKPFLTFNGKNYTEDNIKIVLYRNDRM